MKALTTNRSYAEAKILKAMRSTQDAFQALGDLGRAERDACEIEVAIASLREVHGHLSRSWCFHFEERMT